MSKPPAPRPRPEGGGKDQDLTPLEAEVDRQIGSIVSQNVRAQVVERVAAIVASETFSGPIAHPSHLREYEAICPGSADRIISMAEERNRHIMKMEEVALTAEVRDQKRGLDYGLVAFLVLVAGAIYCAVAGNNAGAGIFLGAAALGAVGLFVRDQAKK